MPQPRIYPPLIMLAFGALMWVLDSYLPLMALIDTQWQRAGYLLMAAAITLDLWALGLFHRAGTTVHPLRLENNSALVTGGIYRLTRNPMYLGLLILLAGLAVRLGSLSPFLLLPLFVWTVTRSQITHEEKYLSHRYGELYAAYRNRVPRWI